MSLLGLLSKRIDDVKLACKQEHKTVEPQKIRARQELREKTSSCWPKQGQFLERSSSPNAPDTLATDKILTCNKLAAALPGQRQHPVPATPRQPLESFSTR